MFRGINLQKDDILVISVPPIQDNDSIWCGPACFASVASYWGWQASYEKLLVLAGEKSLVCDWSALDLESMADAAGLKSFSYQGTLEDLREQLMLGRPLITMIRPPPDPTNKGLSLLSILTSIARSSANHWVVVIGWTSKDEIVIYDPSKGYLAISSGIFDNWWKDRHRICVLLVN